MDTHVILKCMITSVIILWKLQFPCLYTHQVHMAPLILYFVLTLQYPDQNRLKLFFAMIVINWNQSIKFSSPEKGRPTFWSLSGIQCLPALDCGDETQSQFSLYNLHKKVILVFLISTKISCSSASSNISLNCMLGIFFTIQ